VHAYQSEALSTSHSKTFTEASNDPDSDDSTVRATPRPSSHNHTLSGISEYSISSAYSALSLQETGHQPGVIESDYSSPTVTRDTTEPDDYEKLQEVGLNIERSSPNHRILRETPGTAEKLDGSKCPSVKYMDSGSWDRLPCPQTWA
jgi:hypothetical protein